MNRVLALAAALAATATATVTILPAMAAPRPASARAAVRQGAGRPGTGRPATVAGRPRAAATAQRAMAAAPPAVEIPSELDGGTYVTVVQCSGPVDSPPPVTLLKPGTPLTVHGGGSSSAVLRLLKKPAAYRTVYTCRVIVREKVPSPPAKAAKRTRPRHVTINTGFGGMAPQVSLHHPAG
jgi:hypothetical protein